MSKLGLTEAQAFYLQRVTRKAPEVPALKVAIREGTLSLSQARRIEPVLTNSNNEEWIRKATELTQKELEREVTRANPNAREKKVSKLEQNLKRLRALLGKGKEDLLIQATELLLDKVDPERKAERAVVSSRKPRAVTKAPARGRTPLTASVKHQVVYENGYQCAECGTSRHLHFHHLKPVSEGGRNLPENLRLLCYGHHRVAHSRRAC